LALASLLLGLRPALSDYRYGRVSVLDAALLLAGGFLGVAAASLTLPPGARAAAAAAVSLLVAAGLYAAAASGLIGVGDVFASGYLAAAALLSTDARVLAATAASAAAAVAAVRWAKLRGRACGGSPLSIVVSVDAEQAMHDPLARPVSGARPRGGCIRVVYAVPGVPVFLAAYAASYLAAQLP